MKNKKFTHLSREEQPKIKVKIHKISADWRNLPEKMSIFDLHLGKVCYRCGTDKMVNICDRWNGYDNLGWFTQQVWTGQARVFTRRDRCQWFPSLSLFLLILSISTSPCICFTFLFYHCL